MDWTIFQFLLPAIAATNAAVLDRFVARPAAPLRDLEDVLAVDAWARRAARERLAEERAPAAPRAAAISPMGGSV